MSISLYTAILVALVGIIMIVGIFFGESKKITKTILITGMILQCLLVYRALDDLKGTPKEPRDDKVKATLHSFLIKKPNIYVWLVEEGKSIPETIRLPFSEKLKKKLEGLKKKYKSKSFGADLKFKKNPLKRKNNQVDEVEVKELPHHFLEKI